MLGTVWPAAQFRSDAFGRLLDTRSAGGTLGAGGVDSVAVAGQGGIPATGVNAALLNVTATNTTAGSYFTVYPSTRPNASDLNWAAGQTVPNMTVATLGGTGKVNVFNAAGSADLVVDTSGYFGLLSTVPTMVSAVVTTGAPGNIVITYNVPVVCPTAAYSDFTYDYTTGTFGGSPISCSDIPGNDTLTLVGNFVTPGASATITYTEPSSPTSGGSGNAVYSFNSPIQFALTQTLTLAVAPAMTAAVVTPPAPNGTAIPNEIYVAYNESAVCVGGAAPAFSYSYDGTSAHAVAATGCAVSGGSPSNVLILSFGAALTAPTTGANLVYTLPSSPLDTTAVYAYNGGAPSNNFAATQTLPVAAITVPTITSANVTTSAISVVYNEAVTCPDSGGFVYDSSLGTSGGAIASCSASGSTVTLNPATTFTVPTTGGATLTYTQPFPPTDALDVFATANGANFAVDQTLTPTPIPAPVMVTALVDNTGLGTITVTYNEPVSCPGAVPSGLFSYNFDGGTGDAVQPVHCASGAGFTLVLSFGAGITDFTTGGSLQYTAPGISTTSNAVYATGSTKFAATQNLTNIGNLH